MATITIDEKQYPVQGKPTVMQMALENGISIPHFCWHPRLSIAGNCRICLVEIEKMPKLAISCQTIATDGMVVRTASPKVIESREAVMEFLLINHPLDCPICDEAGECKLQDYAYQHSIGQSRFEFDKVRKPKRVELGPRVTLDTERCIMCSRCIRFCDEIVKKPQLVFTQRGDHVELTTFPGEQLDNAYSMNTIDLCPVGALTSSDFRFKSRVWEMSSTDTICQGCARGCNAKMWVRNNEILRLTPRLNPDVNDYWMCDHGRLDTFKHVNAPDRIHGPMIRKEGELVEVGWDEAVALLGSELKTFKGSEIAAIGSPYATNEDNYIFRKLMNHLDAEYFSILPHLDPYDCDDFLVTPDKTPNSRGANLAASAEGRHPADHTVLVEKIRGGGVKLLYVMEDDIGSMKEFEDVLPKLEILVVHASNHNMTTKHADIVLASSTYAEKGGTMINVTGRVQKIRPAVVTAYQERSLDGFSMSRWDKFGAPNDRWTRGMKHDVRDSWRILAGLANAFGLKWRYHTSQDVFAEMTTKIPELKGLTYQAVDRAGAQVREAKKTAVAAGA
ncbi:MAG TPA: molybdopterin-dependent oxidoreductase [Bacteroidota bacterium]|nr:molybdopterin-dependent oxidoreductase [Bacteroidota bacterium]